MTEGHCDERFAEVRAEFARNFHERGEIGASACVMHEGRVVVDLWGGSATEDGTRPWTRDTLVVVFSCTKGATALCAHLLADAGELELDAPVSRYWPAFAGDGRSEITVRMLLTHQAGLPGVSKPLSFADVVDFDRMARLMEEERPLWQPGTRYGYHALTFGWLVGEVVRRVSGETVGRLFRDAIGGPLGLDFWIGLPDDEGGRVASIVLPDESDASAFDEALARAEPLQVAAENAGAGLAAPGAFNAPSFHACEMPAINGIANGRALAGMYSALACDGIANGRQVVSADQIAVMAATASAGRDAVLLDAYRRTTGFEKGWAGSAHLTRGDGLTLSEPAFGHSGLGGSIGFADPQERISFGYTMNRHPGRGEAPAARYQPLIDATYRALGYRSCASGRWVR